MATGAGVTSSGRPKTRQAGRWRALWTPRFESASALLSLQNWWLMDIVFSSVQCCFTSTETIRTIRDEDPRASTSTFTQLWTTSHSFTLLYVHVTEAAYGLLGTGDCLLFSCCFTSTEATYGLLGTGHCLATVLPFIMAHIAAHLNTQSFWW